MMIADQATIPTNKLNKRPLLAVSPQRAFVLLMCIWLFCFVISSTAIGFLITKFPESTSAIRIGAVLQDLLVFIIPALCTAMLITRLPATLLGVDRGASINTISCSLFALLLIMPALNLVMALNGQMHLPESLSGVEEWMRHAEDNATATIELTLGGEGVGNLLMSVLIVSILAGFSEELFFRGALQRIVGCSSLGKHAAVWIAALVFSGIHLQFYGFFPRLLLGAYFGYLLLWTGSLWVPILAHIANNLIYIVSRWINLGKDVSEDTMQTILSPSYMLFAAALLVLAYFIIRFMRKSIASESKAAEKKTQE